MADSGTDQLEALAHGRCERVEAAGSTDANNRPSASRRVLSAVKELSRSPRPWS